MFGHDRAEPIIEHYFITRRTVVAELGKAGLGIVVFGAACATGAGDPSTTSSGNSTTSPSTSTPPTSQPGSTTQPTAEAAGYQFQRVNLDFVSAYILYRAGEAVLVDTGVRGSSESIGQALDQAGLGWDAVGHVILTHKHPDHVGSLAEVLAETSGPTLYAGAADIPQIDTPISPTPVGNGDRIFDLEIIETPGHTAGHVSVLDPVTGILVSGDALNGSGSGVNTGGTGVGGANPQFSEDMDAARSSVKKLAGFDYETILFGHGEPVLVNGSQLVGDLAAQLP